MSTLLLVLDAPLQSWGDDSKFNVRRTYTIPTKSGVIGLLAAASGLPRTADRDIQHLNKSLTMGVRVDQPGELIEDYHTIKRKEATSHHGPEFDVTRRQYLSDAVFVVGLESKDDHLIEQLEEDLHHPVYPLFLGRRSCPPTLPLSLGIRNTSLIPALQNEPWHAAEWCQKRLNPNLRLVIESKVPGSHPFHRLKDVPISYNPIHRQYTYRYAEELDLVQIKGETETEHDPFNELR